MFDIPCVILAGGKSSRMREDKCFLPYKNTTLVQYQYDRLKTIFSKVYLSSKTNKFNFCCDLIVDDNDIYSPLIALNTIANSIQQRFFLIPVDSPNVSFDSIEKIIQNSKNTDINIVKTYYNTHNLCGVFSSHIKEQIKIMLDNNDHKISKLISKVNSKETYINNEDELININTKEDYKKLL
jgi:molybdopterin-guanine dinucleotide biosynthesis protein A